MFLNLSKILFGDADFFRLEHPVFLILLLFLVVFLLLYIVNYKRQKNRLSSFFSHEVLPKIFPATIKKRKLFRFLIWCLAMVFLAVGITNPQFGSKKEEVEQKGVDLVFALDVSKSMLAEDIKPNRLDRAKHAMTKVIDRLGADRIAIVVFAGDAFLQLPLTNDHAAAKMYLDEIKVGMIPRGGTSIPSALEKSLAALPENRKGGAVILITDGEDQDEKAVEMAEKCAENDVKVYALGMGTQRGSTIPVYVNGRKVGLKKDNSGSTVVSKINEALLIEVASKGNGAYIRASNESLGLSQLFDQINLLDKSEFGQKKFTSYEHRFLYFVGFAMVLLMVEFLLFSNKIYTDKSPDSGR